MAANMVMSSTLDLFKKPETDYSIESYRMVTIQPTTTGINQMEFYYPETRKFCGFEPKLLFHGTTDEKE